MGWTVEAELGAKLSNGHMWRYLRDPEEYHRELQVNLPYYSTVYRAEDARDILAVLGLRLERARKALAAIPGKIAAWEVWRPIVEHFITAHNAARDSLQSVVEAIDNQAKIYLPAHAKTLQSIIEHLEKTAAWYKSKNGAAELVRMKTQFSDGFFAREEARVQGRTARLEGLARGKSYESFSPPASGQVTWTQLKDMYSKDRKENPEHWKK